MTQRSRKTASGASRRELQREQTRERLLTEGEQEFIRGGFRDASTAAIAKAAGVAHGTVFLHFPTKEDLLSEIVLRHAQEAMNELHARAGATKDLESLLDAHLEVIARHEDFEVALARESALLPGPLMRRVVIARTGIGHHLYERLRAGVEEGRYAETVDPTVALSFWFGTLQYHLAHRELFAPKAGLIRTRGAKLKEFFLQSIERRRRR